MDIIEIDSSSEGEDDGIAENGRGSLVFNVDIVDRHVSVLDHGEGACMTVQRRALPPSLQPPPPQGRGPTLSAKPTNGSAAADLTSMVKDPTNDRQILLDEDRDGKGMPNNIQRRALPPSLQPPPPWTVVGPHGGGPTLNAQVHTKLAAANLTSKVKDYIGILKRKRKLQSEDEDPMDYNVKRNQVVGTYGSHPPSRTVPNTAAGGAHWSQYPPVKKEKLVNINVPRSSNGTIDERRPLYPLVKKEKLVTADVTIASYGNKVKKEKFITTGVTMASNGSQDDIHISRNAGTHRVLPPSLMNGTSASSSSPLAGAGDAGEGSGLVDERLIEQEERIIYQEALQNLGQTKLEDDLPEGLLSVILLKHQKIALAWMVQREASCHCAGGILADDQGLGKTISMIALIQKQRTPLSKSISDGSCQIKTEALNLDEDDETIEIDKECVTDVKREQVTGTSIHTSGKRRTPPLKFTSDGSCQLNTEVLNLDEDDATIEIDKECEIGDVTREQVASTSIHTSSKWKPSAGTLVVCPASILRQWARELDEKVTSSGKLSVLMYHGGARTRDPGELAKYNVVLTTYSIVSKEVPKKDDNDDDEQRNFDKYGISSEWYTRLKRKKSPALTKGRKKEKGSKDSILDHDSGPLARVRWFRIILDEAQIIKNHRTQIARACSWLRAKRRWCLSGTPIQNSIDDLYSYLRFLKYTPYADYVSFYNLIKKPIERDSVNGYRKLQALLRVFLLRRTKDTLIDGEPVVKLPPKTIVLKKVDFSPEERSFYLKLESDSRQKFKAYAAAGTVKQNYANILLMLLRLRQACDHPVLVRDHRPDTVGKDSLQIARQLPRDMLISLLNQLEASMAICRTCNDPPEDAVVTMCHHVFCFQCVSERLTGEDNVCPAAGCKDILNSDSVFSRATLRSCISDELNDNNASTSVLACDEESSVVQSYVSSKIKVVLEILNSLGSPSYVNGSEECKVKDCCQVDTNLRSCTCSHFRPKPEIPVKTIIFSQWNGMLDLLEVPLKRSLIQYRRLDGTMSLNSRDRAVEEFNNDLEVMVMLMSLKAGNLGLNMIAACHVILVDLWWNPTTEDQAVDRAHRIGQTRPVTVSRLTIKDSVEDRILALQEEKRKMVASAFGEDQYGSQATRLTEQDLRFLFKI